MFVPGTLIVPGNATATANNILGSELLFRVGIVTDLIGTAVWIFLIGALYRLLSGVDKTQASLMVILALISVPVSFFNMVNEIAALTLLRGAGFLSVFNKPQIEAMAIFFLGLRGSGLAIAELFWGLWLFPFGMLVLRSGFLPKILGVLLLVNGFAYVAISLTSLLLPAYGNVLFRYSMPALLGEVWIWLWLMIKGIKVEAKEAPAP